MEVEELRSRIGVNCYANEEEESCTSACSERRPVEDLGLRLVGGFWLLDN